MLKVASSSWIMVKMRNCIKRKSSLTIAHTASSVMLSALSVVMTMPLTAVILAVCVPMLMLSPTLPACLSSVMLWALWLTTRPLMARPAKTLSATLITCPTCGIKPCKPVLKLTVRVSSCSDFNAHCPARCACDWLVQPKIAISSIRMPYLAIARSSRTSSYSVL